MREQSECSTPTSMAFQLDRRRDTSYVQVDVDSLLRDLGDPSCEREETKYALIQAGPSFVRPLTNVAASLDPFGKLMAIEVFEALNDPEPAPVLTDMLADDNSTVREWAADLLGSWRYQPALPA